MADFFSKGITALNVKTANFLEAKKIQTYISTLNSEIEALQKEIGVLVYEKWNQTGEISLELVASQLEQISQKKQTILEQTQAAEELERRQKQILGTGDSGAKPGKIFCPNCGQGYDTPVKFCRKCGTKLQ